MTDPHHLNPGSIDAVNQGCRCPTHANYHGVGVDGRGRKFWIDPECRLHGVGSLADDHEESIQP